MIRFASLTSGSSGNSIYVGTGETHLLIDAGVSGKCLQERLRLIGVDGSELSGILITHEHSDHINAVGVLSRRFNLPLYATDATWAAMEPLIGRVAPANRRVISAGEDFFIGGLGVMPFSIPHDAADPVGYRLSTPRESVAVATDIGHVTNTWANYVEGADLVLLESNHDLEMLNYGPYPEQLKQRIRGKRGHLSNDDCAKAAVRLCERGTRRIILGHLSQHNNLPELARATTARALERAGAVLDGDVALSIACRDRLSECYTIG